MQRDYFGNNETEVYRTKAIDEGTAWSEGDEGDLVCTNSRLVFSKGSEIIDISRDSIDSMEYEPPKYDMDYLYTGLIFMGIGLAGFFVEVVIDEGIAAALGGIMAFAGLVVILVGFLYRRSSLKIHTAKKSFEFESNNQDLEEVIKSIRKSG
jgi:hypothetical protein